MLRQSIIDTNERLADIIFNHVTGLIRERKFELSRTLDDDLTVTTRFCSSWEDLRKHKYVDNFTGNQEEAIIFVMHKDNIGSFYNSIIELEDEIDTWLI